MSNDAVILFACEHGAAKSVLAAELFGRRAAALDLPLSVRAAGIEPDDIVSERLLELLPERAQVLASIRPRRVTERDLQDAAVTVTFNLAASALPVPSGLRLAWDDIPPVSEDPKTARAAIERHVEELLERLRT